MANSWTPQFKRQEVVILKEEEAYFGYCQIKNFEFEIPLFAGGRSQPISRELIYRPSAVAVILVDPDQDKVVLIEQFRPGGLYEADSPWLLEVVAGLADPGEDIETAAKREVKEETGCEVLSLIHICGYLTTPGISCEKIQIYCGRIKAPVVGGNHGIVAEGEDIKVHIFKTEVAFKLLEEGKVLSSPALIALQWLKLNQTSLRFPQEIQ